VPLLQREELDKSQDKEAAYVLSLAQGFMEKEELEVWLASVRTVKAAVIKTTVHAMDSEKEALGKFIGPKGGGLRMEVSKRFQIKDKKNWIAFLEVLGGLARIANAMRDGEDEYLYHGGIVAVEYRSLLLVGISLY
jgi:hypothetical protein